MRIAVLSAALSIHTIKWVNALAGLGHTVVLFSLPDHKAPYSGINSDVNVYYLKRGGAAGYWLGARELKARLAAFKPDVVSAHYATGYGTLARRCGFKPVLLSVWGSDVYDFPNNGHFYKRIVQKNLEAATAIASTSNAMARQVERIYNSEKKIYITPFGVDTERFHPMEKESSGGVTIGIVKTLEPNYGVEYLLRAFSLLNKRLIREGRMPSGGLRLEIYGSGSLLETLRALACELEISEQTHFNGHINHSKVPDALSRFDIFCAPSVSESFGVAAVEAMACGLPVVVSDVDGFREVVRDRETGFIVTRRDYVSLSNKLHVLTLDPELRRRMGEAGRAHVISHYQWQDCVAAMEKALFETSQNKTVPRRKRAGKQP